MMQASTSEKYREGGEDREDHYNAPNTLNKNREE